LFTKYGSISAQESEDLLIAPCLRKLERKREVFGIRFGLNYRSKRMFHSHEIFHPDFIHKKYYFKDKASMLRFCSKAITDVTAMEFKASKLKIFLRKHFTDVEIEVLVKMIKGKNGVQQNERPKKINRVT
jgi:hypothetical protein